MKAELLDTAVLVSIGMSLDSSFIHSGHFLDWLSRLRNHSKSSKDQPVLLILDNHVPHFTLKAVEFYRENNIIAMTLPPHSSHKMQPLDRGCHKEFWKTFIPASVKNDSVIRRVDLQPSIRLLQFLHQLLCQAATSEVE